MLNYHNSGSSPSPNNGNQFTFSSKKSTCPNVACGKGNFHAITHISGVANTRGGGNCFNCGFIPPEKDLHGSQGTFTAQYSKPQFTQRVKDEKPEPAYFDVIAEYIYTDENGNPKHKAIREDGRNKDGTPFLKDDGKIEKRFWQHRFENGIWRSGVKGFQLYLYRLPKVLKAIQQGETIYIVEGEKCVHTLERYGLTATTSPAGAKAAWIPDYSETLRNANVIVFPDNDPDGKHHAEKIVNSLLGIAASVKVVSLRNLPPKGDVTDFFNSGGTLEQLLKEVSETPEITRPIVNLPEQTPEQEFIENFILENAPEIPFHIYAALPPFLKELCGTFTESHEKAVFLTSGLPIAAAHMPNVITRNADRFHTLDFYAAIVARAGSGKGKAEFAFRLASVTDAYILKTSQDKFEQWKNENALKERKGKKQDSEPEKPQEPMPIVRGLAIPANTPATPFIRKLKANGGRGLLKESEIDVLNGTLKQDWGALIDPLLRQAFHHETYSLSRTQTKDSEESESRIETPQISVVLTGTENQMIRLLGKGGIENGLYSRFALYCLEAPDVWQSRRPSVKFDVRESLFKNASEKLFQLWQMLRVHQNLEISLTDEQFDLIDSTFAALRSDWRLRNHDIAIITQRSALIAQRIIGILTVLRNIDCELYKTDELIPTDSDAQTGVELAVIYFEHAARFAVCRLNSRITNNTDKKQQGFELKTQGVGNREISRILGISHTTVNNWFKNENNGNSGKSGNHFPLSTLSTTETKQEFETPEISEPEPLRSASKPTPEQLQPESLELVSTEELNAGFFGERTTAKFNLIKALCEARNITGGEAETLIKNSIAYGLLHDTKNDKYERCDL